MLQVIASVITALGVLFAGVNLRSGLVQRNRQFESLYIQRYWELTDKLSASTLIDEHPKPSSADRVTLRLYFQLCQDEIEMYQRGWVSHRTFVEWFDGMSTTLERQPYSDELGVFLGQSPQDHLVELRAVATGNKKLPRRRIGLLKRWARGV